MHTWCALIPLEWFLLRVLYVMDRRGITAAVWKKALDTAAHAFDMAVAHAAVSSATKYDFGAWSSRQSLVNAGRQQRIWQGEYALLPGRAAECFRGLVLDLPLDKKESQAGPWGRSRVGRKSQIVAASPPAEELAVRTEPLTKQDLVAYLASGCKPKEKWRSAFLFSPRPTLISQ